MYSERAVIQIQKRLLLSRGLRFNSTTGALATPGVTTTAPVTVDLSAAGNNVIVLPPQMHKIQLLPFGTGALGSEFDMYLWRYMRTRKLPGVVTDGDTWIPTLMAHLRCALSAAVGLAGMDIIATERVVEVITQIAGTPNLVSYNGLSTAGVVDIEHDAPTLIQISFVLDTATAANTFLAFR